MTREKTKIFRAGSILVIIFFSLFAFPLLVQPVQATMVTVGSNPKGVAITPNGAYAYVTNYDSNTVSVISTVTDTVTATIPVGNHPLAVAVAPNGAYAYVTNRGDSTVSVISTATNTVISTIPVGTSPISVAVTPNGAYAYVTNLNNDSVSVINTASNTVMATITGFSAPYDVAVTNAYAYVTTLGSDTYGVGFVSVINTATNTVTSTITVGYEPLGVAVTPDGTHAYVAINGKYGVGSVAVINTAINKVTTGINVGNYPVDVGVMPNGACAYVVNVNDGARPGQGNPGNGSVSVISTATNTVISTIAVGNHPAGVALTDSYAFVTNSGNDTVSVLSTGIGPQIPAIDATASTYTGIHEPLFAIDGIESASNYWGTSSANMLPQWLKIDTGFTANINQVVTHFYDGDARTYTYYIEASADGTSWTTIVPTKIGIGIVTDMFSEVAARYVRLTVTGNTANNAAHIEEIRVFQSADMASPSPTPQPGSQIPAVTASASSFNGETFGPLNAIDGIESTSSYWGTAAVFGLPQWLRVDLGSVASISQVVTHFYDGSTRTYTYYVDVSVDGSLWTPVVSEKIGVGVVTDTFSPEDARFVRITVTGNTANTAAHIEEIKVYQSTGTPTPTPTPSPTPAPTPSPTPLSGLQIPAIAASASSYNGIHEPLYAIDGIESTSNYWGTAAVLGLPQWLKIDLGFVTSITQVVTHFYDGDARTYTYYIEASADGSSWSTVVPAKTGSGIITDLFAQVAARYIRITLTGNTANTAAHVEEIKVFQSADTNSPSPTPQPGSQIPAVTASASSFNGETYGPLNAIDGVESTSNYWGTAAVLGLPQWLQIDLGFGTIINQVVTHFYDGSTRTYTYYIEASADGLSWGTGDITVVPAKTGVGVVTDTFSPVWARYVRITVTGNTANTAAHVEEIKVYNTI